MGLPVLGPMRERVPGPLRPLARQVRLVAYRGNTVECPCCGATFRQFAPFGSRKRPNARCLRCGSLERHRLQWLYLLQETDLYTAPKRVLHIAPEPQLRWKLAAQPSVEYVTADLLSPDVDVRMDITSMPFPDGSFDVILCNHVLEHVQDDEGALRELLRVLRPGGWAILQSALRPELERTWEDASITTPEERERCFGERDHVRVYGRDYAERVRAAGFEVRVDEFVRTLDSSLVRRYALDPLEDLYICMRPVLPCPRT